MLDTDQARDRAHDIVTRARKQGADAADAVFAADASLDVSVRLGKLEDIGRSESAELGLRVFVGRRSASVSTSDLSAAALDTHALVRRLRATGLSEDQAEAITAAIRESRDSDLTNLVTKTDLAEAKFDIMKWVIGSIGFQTIVIVGAIVALSRAAH